MTAAAPAGRPDLAELLELTSPATRARTAAAETVPVLPPLAGLLPYGGLARGSVTTIGDDLGLALAVAAGPATATESTWMGVVGIPELGLLAATGYGIRHATMLLVDTVAPEQFGDVVTALADACQVLLVRPPVGLPERTATRITARLRRTGTVLLAYGRGWPGAQLQLSVTGSVWRGLGPGHGLLTGRLITVQVNGRGAAARPRIGGMLAPNDHGRLAPPPDLVGTRSLTDPHLSPVAH